MVGCTTSQQHASVSLGQICLTSQQHASVSLGQICTTSQQHASVSLGQICLTSQQHASVSLGQICSDICKCCRTETDVADPTWYLIQSQHTDTRSTSPSADPIMPGAWQARNHSRTDCCRCHATLHILIKEGRFHYRKEGLVHWLLVFNSRSTSMDTSQTEESKTVPERREENSHREKRGTQSKRGTQRAKQSQREERKTVPERREENSHREKRGKQSQREERKTLKERREENTQREKRGKQSQREERKTVTERKTLKERREENSKLTNIQGQQNCSLPTGQAFFRKYLDIGCLTSHNTKSVFWKQICLDNFLMLPHCDRSCRLNLLSHLVTVFWYRAKQS